MAPGRPARDGRGDRTARAAAQKEISPHAHPRALPEFFVKEFPGPFQYPGQGVNQTEITLSAGTFPT
jgi:hypothetical protein